MAREDSPRRYGGSSKQHGSNSTRDRERDDRRPYDDRRRRQDNDDRGYRNQDRSPRRDYGRPREYGERDREEERKRDRDRFHGGRDERDDGQRRRSASPRGRSPSGSAPPDLEDKSKPNFGASGLLAAETKKVTHEDGTSTVLKYHEPPEARKPVVGWRLYVFKGSEQVDLLHIQRQSAYLFGRDRAVVDVPLEHPSSSKQHAVIQYRQLNERNEFGEVKGVIKPFIIDLESTNGTHVNDEQIPAARYYELKVNDVIKFGLSNREYVLLHDEAT